MNLIKKAVIKIGGWLCIAIIIGLLALFLGFVVRGVVSVWGFIPL